VGHLPTSDWERTELSRSEHLFLAIEATLTVSEGAASTRFVKLAYTKSRSRNAKE